VNVVEPPAGPALKLPQGSLFNTVQNARVCLSKLAAWGNAVGAPDVTIAEAARLLGLNSHQTAMFFGDVNRVLLTTLWRYVEWVRLNDVLQDTCRDRGAGTLRRVKRILPGRVWQVPWRGGTQCTRYEDMLLWRKLMRLEALAGLWATREIGLDMMLTWAQLPAVEAAVMVAEASRWAMFDKRSRGGKNRWRQGNE
jgi:hypothetical protein